MTSADTESHADAAEGALAQAMRLRQAVMQRRAAERLEVASLEQESRALHDELALMERSAGRRLYLTFRAGVVRTLLAARHPAWTTGSALRAAGATRVPATLRAAARHLRRRTFPLRLTAPVAEQTDQPDDFAAIRWIGPTRIRHEVLESLLCHPSSTGRVPGERAVRFAVRDVVRRLSKRLAPPSRRRRLPGACGHTADRLDGCP